MERDGTPRSPGRTMLKILAVAMVLVLFGIQNNEIHVAALLVPSVIFIHVLIVAYYCYFVRYGTN